MSSRTRAFQRWLWYYYCYFYCYSHCYCYRYYYYYCYKFFIKLLFSIDSIKSSLSMNLDGHTGSDTSFPRLKNITQIKMSSLCSTIYQAILVSIVFHQTPRYSRYRLIRTNTVINMLTVEIFVRWTWNVGNLYWLKININRIKEERKKFLDE